jgi:toxin-antitoxin system PIN domain toxin
LIGVDTNILVYAHRSDSPWHKAANDRIRELAEGRSAWAIAWPSVHEFLAVVTNLRIFKRPTAIAAAIDQVGAWLESPALELLGETEFHWGELRRLIEAGRVAGARVHDARIAALCAQHGVREFWSVDRDFSRFPDLKIVNPLVR